MRLLVAALDWPPVWTALALTAAWALDRVAPLGLFGPLGQVAGLALAAVGFGLMGLAVGQMVLARTTFVPRADPSALVTGGIFRLTRNPIYLGDALVLLAAILWWDVPLALPLVPALMSVITVRFIEGEEARLRDHYGAAFDAYAKRTRRWL